MMGGPRAKRAEGGWAEPARWSREVRLPPGGDGQADPDDAAQGHGRQRPPLPRATGGDVDAECQEDQERREREGGREACGPAPALPEPDPRQDVKEARDEIEPEDEADIVSGVRDRTRVADQDEAPGANRCDAKHDRDGRGDPPWPFSGGGAVGPIRVQRCGCHGEARRSRRSRPCRIAGDLNMMDIIRLTERLVLPDEGSSVGMSLF